MAEPITFCGMNKVWQPAPGTEDRVKPLPAYQENGETITCWKLSPAEIEHVVRTGEVWGATQHGAQRFQPTFISGFPLMQALDADTGEETVYHSSGQHIIDDARRFAKLHHGDQRYGTEPYSYHTDAVANLLTEWGCDWIIIAAGHLHDVEEDCMQELPIEERRRVLAERFGTLIEVLVWCCTGLTEIDGVRQERADRNQQQYAKIAEFWQAAFPKTADRIINMRSCRLHPANVRLAHLYNGEADSFFDNVASRLPPHIQALFQEEARLLNVFCQENPQP